MTGAQPHPSHDRRDRIGDLNRYPERNVSRKRATKRRRYALSPWSPLVGSAAKTGNADWNVNRAGVTAGRDRHSSSLLNWRRAGPCFVRAPRRVFSGKAA